MKRLLLVMLLGCATLAQAGERPRVALVLSGGGARGIAHVGVLKVLDEARVPVDCVVGTSMGSIVGGALASGMPAGEMEARVAAANWNELFADRPKRSDVPYFRKQDDWREYFDFTLTLRDFWPVPPKNLVGVHHITQFFRGLTGGIEADHFDHLPIPYRAIGADLESGRAVIMEEGDLPLVMRASMSVPGVFPPVQYKDHLVVDGGIIKNMGIDEGRRLCGDVVIAVNVSSPSSRRSELSSVLAISQQVINIGVQKNVDEQIATLAPGDVLITPDLSALASTDFALVPQFIRAGEQAARQQLSKLSSYALSESEYRAWRDRVTAGRPGNPPIRRVEIGPTRWVSPEVLSSSLNVEAGQPFDQPALHRKLNQLYARGDFERLTYNLIREQDGTVLRVNPLEKEGRDFARVGLKLNTNFDDESSFGVLGYLRRGWINHLGAEWKAEVEIGKSRYLYSEFYQPLVLDGKFFVSPRVSYRDELRSLVMDGEKRGDEAVVTRVAGLDFGSVLGKWGEVRLGLSRERVALDNASQVQPAALGVDEDFVQAGYSLRVVYDQIDNPRFPTRGAWARLGYYESSDSLGSEVDFHRVELHARKAFTWGRNTLLLTGHVGATLDGELPFQEQFELGGLMNLTAYALQELRGQSMAQIRLASLRKFRDMPAGLGSGVYYGLLLESGAVGEGGELDRPLLDEMHHSVGLMLVADTRLGPAYLAVAQGDDGHQAAYLALGISY